MVKSGSRKTYVIRAIVDAADSAMMMPCSTITRASPNFFSPISRATTDDMAMLMPNTICVMIIVTGNVSDIPARMFVSPNFDMKYVSASCTAMTARIPQTIGTVRRIR